MPRRIAPGRSVELRSIDYVPRRERHGKVWHQGPFWFASNFVVLTLVVGFSGPANGLGLGWSAVAMFLGNLIGAFFMVFHANQGPRLGVPQMIQSRAQFGMRGTLVPLAAALFVYVGFNVFNVPIATQGFQALVGAYPDWIFYVAIIAAQAAIAASGYHLIHLIQRWLSYALIVVFSVLSVGAVAMLGHPDIVGMGGFSTGGFFRQVSIVAGYMIAYAIYVSDYTRYLPADTRLAPLLLWTYAGVVTAGTWLMTLGAFLALTLQDTTPVASIITAGNLISPGFGLVAIAIASVGLVTVAAVNSYGATLVALTVIGSYGRRNFSARARTLCTLFISLVTLVAALTLPDQVTHALHGFLALILYFLIPWSAVNLVDYYWVRRGRYSVVDLFDANGIYQQGAVRGLIAYAAGFTAMIPFFLLPFYTGPVARALGGVDLSPLAGLIVAGLVYLYLCRDLDLAAEEESCQRSMSILEPDLDDAPGKPAPVALT